MSAKPFSFNQGEQQFKGQRLPDLQNYQEPGELFPESPVISISSISEQLHSSQIQVSQIMVPQIQLQIPQNSNQISQYIILRLLRNPSWQKVLRNDSDQLLNKDQQIKNQISQTSKNNAPQQKMIDQCQSNQDSEQNQNLNITDDDIDNKMNNESYTKRKALKDFQYAIANEFMTQLKKQFGANYKIKSFQLQPLTKTKKISKGKKSKKTKKQKQQSVFIYKIQSTNQFLYCLTRASIQKLQIQAQHIEEEQINFAWTLVDALKKRAQKYSQEHPQLTQEEVQKITKHLSRMTNAINLIIGRHEIQQGYKAGYYEVQQNSLTMKKGLFRTFRQLEKDGFKKQAQQVRSFFKNIKGDQQKMNKYFQQNKQKANRRHARTVSGNK